MAPILRFLLTFVVKAVADDVGAVAGRAGDAVDFFSFLAFSFRSFFGKIRGAPWMRV
jgi:hypothetical protein